MAESQFHMIWKDGGGAPTRKHTTFDEAQHEAERLARATPGVRFYVMTAEHYAVFTEPVTWVQLDAEVPF